MVDLATIRPGTRTIEILLPGDAQQKVGIRVEILSINDEKLAKIKREITNNKLALGAKGKHFKIDDLERNNHELLFTAMLGWEWYNPTGDEKSKGYDADAMPSFNGEVPDFNKKNVMAMFNMESLYWFHDQINEAVSDTAGFFGS